jgi:hypothetical protein
MASLRCWWRRLVMASPYRLCRRSRSNSRATPVCGSRQDPNFKLVIHDFIFPPDKQPHTVTLPYAAFLHFLSEPGEISIAQQRSALTAVARTAVPPGAPIELVNNGEHPVIVRALIVEAK